MPATFKTKKQNSGKTFIPIYPDIFVLIIHAGPDPMIQTGTSE
jgi:hypothetical protein